MKMPAISLLEWQQQFGDEESCLQALAKIRWPDGFICPHCGTKKACYLRTRKKYQCAHCRHQVSVTANTIFHSTNLSLVKWFWAIYLTAADKGGLSALRLSKQIKVSWPTARNMLRKIRITMGHRDSLCRLENVIELEETAVGGKRAGQRGRGASGKQSVLVAVETKGKRAGFMAIKAVGHISAAALQKFLLYHVKNDPHLRTGTLQTLEAVNETRDREKQVLSPEETTRWLPMVHLMIGNIKTFVNGTFHGVSSEYLQEYLDEFCYRFNRRFWEEQLPLRLLNACLAHTQVKLAENHL